MSTWSPTFSASSLSTEVPTLPAGAYAARIANASITGKEGKQYFGIQKARVWNRETKSFDDVLNEDGSQKYEINARILVQAVLTSKKAIDILGRDEPSFLRWIDIRFDDKFNLDGNKNMQFAKLMDVVGLDYKDFFQYVDASSLNTDVPDEIAHQANASEMVQALDFWRNYFTQVCMAIKDQNVKAVIERKTKTDGSVENVITENRTICGFIKYEDGCENDLI